MTKTPPNPPSRKIGPRYNTVTTDEIEKQAVAYEWVLDVRGEEVILTEAQYDHYQKRIDMEDYRNISFPTAEVKPNMVSSARKRKAIWLKERFPCKSCHASGYLPEFAGFCPDCNGSGVKLS